MIYAILWNIELSIRCKNYRLIHVSPNSLLAKLKPIIPSIKDFISNDAIACA